jgi:hypothetical protein
MTYQNLSVLYMEYRMNVELHIDNSYSRICGLSVAHEKELSKLLSYVIGGSSSYYSGFGPRRKSLLDKRGMFASGLKHRVIDFLNTKRIPFKTKDLRVRPNA